VAEAYFQKGVTSSLCKLSIALYLTCQYLRSLGFEITFLPVQSDGLIDLADLEQAFRSDTILVSMAANNEIEYCNRWQTLVQSAASAKYFPYRR